MIKEASFISRRFIRVRALQNLYAYQISKQGYFQLALDNILADFKPDSFTKKKIDPVVLTQEKEEAIRLFRQIIAQKEETVANYQGISVTIKQSVQRSLLFFTQALHDESLRLKKGLDKGEVQIRVAYLYILQLLIQWDCMSYPSDSSLAMPMPKNKLLQRLQQDTYFLSVIKKDQINWDNHQEIITKGHACYITNETFIKPSSQEITIANDQAILVHLVKNIIFKQEVIQDFFTNLDLNWTEHKQLVSRLLLATFQQLSSDNLPSQGINIVLDAFITRWCQENKFYYSLIQKYLLGESKYEILIKENVKKWDIKRMALIDQLVIKLALSEIIYCDDIPVKVSINEYIDIAKKYGTEKSGQFINGVLDAIIKKSQKEGTIQFKKNDE